jgi:hypothetical protein
MNLNLRTLFVPAACLLLGACGQNDASTAESTDTAATAALSDNELCTCDALAFGEEEAGDNGLSLECVNLRGKIQAEKLALRLTSDWRNVAQTQAWKTLDADRKHFKGAGCSWDTVADRSECGEMANKVKAGWNAVAETPEWGILKGKDTYKNLQTNWTNAKKIGCYK